MKSDFLTFPSTNNSFQVGFSFLDFTFFTQPSILTPSAIKRLSSHQNSPRHIIISPVISPHRKVETPLKTSCISFVSLDCNNLPPIKFSPEKIFEIPPLPLSPCLISQLLFKSEFFLTSDFISTATVSVFLFHEKLISELLNLNSSLATFPVPPCDGYTSFRPGQARPQG